MRLNLLTGPAEEPITLSEGKAHCRVTTTDEDTLLTALIESTRRYVEDYTKRFLISQNWEVYLDLAEFNLSQRHIDFGRGEIISVNSITTYDSDGNGTVFDSANYRVSGDRIVLEDNSQWPTLDRVFDSMVIDLVFGMGADASEIPQDIKQAMLLILGHWFENREASGDPMFGKDVKQQIPFGATAILAKYRIYHL